MQSRREKGVESPGQEFKLASIKAISQAIPLPTRDQLPYGLVREKTRCWKKNAWVVALRTDSFMGKNYGF